MRHCMRSGIGSTCRRCMHARQQRRAGGDLLLRSIEALPALVSPQRLPELHRLHGAVSLLCPGFTTSSASFCMTASCRDTHCQSDHRLAHVKLNCKNARLSHNEHTLLILHTRMSAQDSTWLERASKAVQHRGACMGADLRLRHLASQQHHLRRRSSALLRPVASTCTVGAPSPNACMGHCPWKVRAWSKKQKEHPRHIPAVHSHVGEAGVPLSARKSSPTPHSRGGVRHSQQEPRLS